MLDVATVAKIFMVIADGMFWRRAVDPDVSIRRRSCRPCCSSFRELLNPVPGPATASNTNEKA